MTRWGFEVTCVQCGKSLGEPIISVVILYISSSIIIISNDIVSLEKSWIRKEKAGYDESI